MVRVLMRWYDVVIILDFLNFSNVRGVLFEVIKSLSEAWILRRREMDLMDRCFILIGVFIISDVDLKDLGSVLMFCL